MLNHIFTMSVGSMSNNYYTFFMGVYFCVVCSFVIELGPSLGCGGVVIERGTSLCHIC